MKVVTRTRINWTEANTGKVNLISAMMILISRVATKNATIVAYSRLQTRCRNVWPGGLFQLVC